MNQDIEEKLLDEALSKWPQLPSRTLARKLINDNKGVWLQSDLERLRYSIRYRRGKAGAAHRNKKGAGNSKEQLSPSVAHDPRKYIPDSDEKAFLPYVLETGLNRDAKIAVLGDLHIPYHSMTAVKACLDQLDSYEPDVIILNGDTLDFYRLSRFDKDPRNRSAKGEIDKANEFLDAIDERYPNAKKIWKDGNHDERFDHYVMRSAPEIYNVIEVTLSKLLELENRGWAYVTDKRAIHAGKLNIIHGHEYPTPMIGPVNAARGLFMRTKACAIVNHHHQISEHMESDIRGNPIATWSLGCLCELHPMYARFNKWSHGYANVTLSTDGEFQVDNKKIHNGKLLN